MSECVCGWVSEGRDGGGRKKRSLRRREGAAKVAAAAAEELISVHNAETCKDSGDKECVCVRARVKE